MQLQGTFRMRKKTLNCSAYYLLRWQDRCSLPELFCELCDRRPTRCTSQRTLRCHRQ